VNKARYAACIFLSLFIFAIINSTLGALLTRYIDHYALAESGKGVPVSMLNIGCIAALISSLWVMGRIHKPHLQWIASVATVLLLIPLGLPPTFAVFSTTFLLLGVAVGYTDTLASSSIADLYDGRRAVAMMCVLHAVFGIAGVACPLAFRAMMSAGLPWYRIYTVLMSAGVAMLTFIIPVSVMTARHTPVQSTDRQRITWAEVRSFFGKRSRLMMLCAIFFYGFYLSGITVWIDRYICVGLSDAGLGALSLSLFWLGLTLSRLLTPLLRVNPTVLIRWSCFATAALVAAGVATGSAPVMCGAGALAGLTSGAIIPLLMHIACQQYKENTLMASTFLFLALYFSQSICPPLMGLIETAWGLTAVMMACPVTVCLCGGAAFFVERADTA